MRPTYEEMARHLGLFLCRDPACGLDHSIGSATLGVVHFNDIRFSWPGAKRFTALCAIALDPDIDNDVQPLWARVYRINRAASEVGKRIHIRVPRRFTKFDRYVVLAGVAGLSNEVPMRKQAYDWARR
jgi:hypothetical protein